MRLRVRNTKCLVGINRSHGRRNTVVGKEQALPPQQRVLPQTYTYGNIERSPLSGDEGIHQLNLLARPFLSLIGEFVI
ncbi:hypothetical protein D3C75_558210 [compost metagenome]